MRILYLTNGFPYPLTSGYLRQYHFIKKLAQKHQITLLSITGRNFIPDHADAMASLVESVYTFPAANGNKSKYQKLLRRTQSFIGNPHPDEAVLKMKASVHKLLNENKYDLIFYSGKQTYPAIEDVKNLPIVVDMCDATTLRIRGRMRHTNPIYLPYLLLEYLIVRQVESKLVREGEHILFASTRDHESIGLDFSAPVTVIPNGIDLDYWKRSIPQRGLNNIVFSGGMDYAPNVDAALYLIEQILPIVRQSHPDAQVWIVGRDPDPRLVKAGQNQNVNVTGYVNDMRPYLDQATVFAAPLRFGAGIQNKVLEAMAMMLPVVASHLAADGLRTEDGCFPPIKVANSPDEFARMISIELDAAAIDPAPVHENRRYVQEYFVWDTIGNKLENIVEAVTKKSR